MKKLLFISLFAALLLAGCSKDEGPGGQGPKIPDNEIWYTSVDGEIVEPHHKDVFGEGVEILSNTYKNGKGVIKFNAPVTEIGYYAFNGYSSLTSITIPDSATTIGVNPFEDCYGLTAFYGKFASADNRCLIVDGVLKSFAQAGLTEYTIPDGVTEIGDHAFFDCTGLTNVTIGNSVTEIGENAFSHCRSLTSITIPDGVIEIGEMAFFGCYGLTSVTIPDSVTTIGNSAFRNCDALKSITIPDGVTAIEFGAFYGCSSLTSITIPDSVTKIENYAFFDCNSLTSVYCRATTPPALGNDRVFKYYDNGYKILENLTAIYVPRESVEAYKAAYFWSEYADLIQPYDF